MLSLSPTAPVINNIRAMTTVYLEGAFFPPQSSIVKMTELLTSLSFDIRGSPETTLFLSKEEVLL